MSRKIGSMPVSIAALVVATIALVSGGVGAYAGTTLGKNSVGTAQIKPHSITMQKLAQPLADQIDPPAPTLPDGYIDMGHGLAYVADAPAATSVTLHIYAYQQCDIPVAVVTFYDANGGVVGTSTSQGGALANGDKDDFTIPAKGPFVTYVITTLKCN